MIVKRLTALCTVALLGACTQAHTPQQRPASLAATHGYEAYKSGDYASAEQHFGDALVREPDNSYALLGMGAVMENTGRYEQAIHFYERASVHGSDDIGTWSYRTDRNLERQGQYGVGELARRNLDGLYGRGGATTYTQTHSATQYSVQDGVVQEYDAGHSTPIHDATPAPTYPVDADYTASGAGYEAPVYDVEPVYDPAPAPSYDPAPTYDATPVYDPAPAYDADPVYDPAPEPMYDPAPAYDLDPTYDPAPAPMYDPAPAYDAGPTYDPAPEPMYDPAPAYDADPTYDPAPAPMYDPAPAYDAGPAYDPAPAPMYDPAPAYDAGPAYDPAPAPMYDPAPAYDANPVYDPAPVYDGGSSSGGHSTGGYDGELIYLGQN